MRPPSDRSSFEGSTNADDSASSGPRRLRARRPATQPRLLEDGAGAGSTASSTALKLDSGPITLLRLARKDLELGLRAVAAGARPTAVVTGMSEPDDTTVTARRRCRELDVAWLADPLLFRTGVRGYRTAPKLEALDYTPGRDGDPYSAAEFNDADLLRRVGRSVVGAQVDLLANAAFGGAFVVERIEDPWLSVNQRLLRVGADAAAAWAVPYIAPVPVRLAGFEGLEAQRLLVRALAARQPDAWLLMLDGLSEDSAPERIVAALRLALLLQSEGAPVILSRGGDLRRLFLAFGVAGVDFGLGRLLRFSVPDFRKGKGGPGPTPGPRMEMPSLACSVPFVAAGRMVGDELVAEADCRCLACASGGPADARMARCAAHNAHVVLGEVDGLRGRPPAVRVAELDRLLQNAAGRWGWLEADAPRPAMRGRIERQRRALASAFEAGLLDSERLAAELRRSD